MPPSYRLRPSRSPGSRRRRLTPNQALLAAAVVAALAVSAPAQYQLSPLSGGRLPANSEQTNAVALGDIDGDGDLDLVCGNSYGNQNGQNQLYVNDGTGSFSDVTATQMPVANVATYAVAFGDVDGDGDLDLVAGNNTQNSLYLNDGTGNFTDVTATQMPVDSDSTIAIAFGDIDGDGDLDLVCGNNTYANAQNRLYVNDGAGNFTDVTATQMPVDNDVTNAIAFGDVDGDGDHDLIAGTYGGQSRLYVNDGTGGFTDVTAAQMPVETSNTKATTLGDVDGDGDLDLVLGNTGGGYVGQQNRLYLNDGTGGFSDVTATRFPVDFGNTQDVVLGDIDDDGDLDAVVGNLGFCTYGRKYSSCYGQQNRLYLNDGSGLFIDMTSQRVAVVPNRTNAVAIGDVDGDGDLDVVAGNEGGGYYSSGGANLIYLNLKAQIDAPLPFKIGQTWTLEAYLRQGVGGPGDVALPFVSFARGSTPVPPFGTFGLDPALAVTLPLIAVPQPLGTGSLTVQVPVQPGLVGINLYAQALLVPSAGQASLSNVIGTTYEGLTPPTITSITPDVAGPGVPVTVDGTDFLTGIVLTIAGAPVPVTALTPTQLTFQMPTNIGCDAIVGLTNIASATATATMNVTPSVTTVTHPSGPAIGGGDFEVIGQDLLGATVMFNGMPMTNITTQTETTIAGTAPPGAPGPAFVAISNAVGCATTAAYTYDGTPVIFGILPPVAGPGVPVTIYGSNFLANPTLTVASQLTPITSQSATAISFQMPAGAGCDSLVQVTNLGTYSTTQIMNGTPVITTSNPVTSGPAAGGTLFYLTGQNFTGVTVTFGNTPMTNILSNSPTGIVGYTPPGTPGPVTVTIQSPVGCPTTMPFTYL